jgi:predicted RNA-binding Zn-ribbon protein involved in translation (DUF1610 family)
MAFCEMASGVSETKQINEKILLKLSLSEKNGLSSSDNAETIATSVPVSVSYNTTDDVKWICPNCGDSNTSSSRICRGCGKDK